MQGTTLQTIGTAELTLLLVAAVLFGASAILFWVTVSRRRGLRRDVREVVQTLEELRAGRTRRRADVEPRSPLVLVSDALHRLGHDLHGRFAEAESAAERWRALTDAARDTAVITTDTDGDVRSFSPGAAALFGWDEDEVLSRPAAVIFEESAYKDLLPKLARKNLRKQGIKSRSTLLRRDGTSFPAEVSVRMLHAATSDSIGFMMVVRDITEQVRLETDLRASEKRYRGLVEGLAEGVVILREGRVVYLNPAAETLLGRSGSEMGDALLREAVATPDVLLVEEQLAAVAAGRVRDEQLNCTLVGPDGSARAEVRIKAGAVDFEGQPAVMLLVRDETTERRIESELRRNEARLDAVLEAASDGIVVLGEARGGAVQMSNRAFADLFALPTPLFLGRAENELLRLLRARGQGAGAVADLIVRAGGAPLKQRLPLGAGPDARELEVTVAPLTRSGRVLGRVVACRDLTEQRRSERRLQEQAEKLQLGKVELERAYRELNEVNAELRMRGGDLDRVNREMRRLDEMKSNLLGNVSHELQTPLVSVRGYTEMILKERLGPITEEQRKGLSLSLKSVDRLIALIDNLLAFSRTDEVMTDIKLTRFPLGDVVREAVDLLRDKIDAKAIDLTVELREDAIELEADRDKVLQVLLNLLSNAVKFTPARGRVGVRAGVEQAGYATVEVWDTGVGIPDEDLGRIFDRNYRVRRSGADEAEGSGLGLAIVRDILRLHGCTVEVRSEEGRGSRFTIALPLAVPEPGTRPAADSAAPVEPPEHASTPEPAPTPEPEGPDESPDAPRPRFRIIRHPKD